MRKLHRVEVATGEEAVGQALPETVAEALGELVGAAQEGLLALSVGVGLGVLESLMEEERTAVVGPRSKANPERSAVRHGYEQGEVTLGGRRLAVRRPRARSADGSAELPLRTYEHFADRDPLSRAVLERMLAGVSTRRYRRTQEPIGEELEQAANRPVQKAQDREHQGPSTHPPTLRTRASLRPAPPSPAVVGVPHERSVSSWDPHAPQGDPQRLR